jgi:hypothetical protein
VPRPCGCATLASEAVTRGPTTIAPAAWRAGTRPKPFAVAGADNAVRPGRGHFDHYEGILALSTFGRHRIAAAAGTTRDLAWVRAEDAVHNIRARLLNGRQTVSRNAVAALVAATADRP